MNKYDLKMKTNLKDITNNPSNSSKLKTWYFIYHNAMQCKYLRITRTSVYSNDSSGQQNSCHCQSVHNKLRLCFH